MRTSNSPPSRWSRSAAKARAACPWSRSAASMRSASRRTRWKKQLWDISTSELQELRPLRKKNRKLKQLVADLLLDKTILRGALSSLQIAVTAAVVRIRETQGLAGSQGVGPRELHGRTSVEYGSA
jgi:hypothetical protein